MGSPGPHPHHVLLPAALLGGGRWGVDRRGQCPGGHPGFPWMPQSWRLALLPWGPHRGERSEGLTSYGTSFSLRGHPLVLEGVGVLTHSGTGIVALLASPRLPAPLPAGWPRCLPGQQLLRSPEPLFHAAATGPALCRRRRVAPGRPARGLEAEAAARALVPPGGGEGRLPLNPQLSAVRREIGSCLFSRSWRRGSRRQAFVVPLSCAKSRCGLCGRPQCVTAGREHAATSTSLSKPAFQAQGARSEEQERPQRSCGGGAGC